MVDDLVNKLRSAAAAQRAGAPDGATTPLADQLDQAADEIARLRAAIRRLADQDATLSVCEGNVTVTMDATLSEAEREALETAAKKMTRLGDCYDTEKAATLRSLLERTK